MKAKRYFLFFLITLLPSLTPAQSLPVAAQNLSVTNDVRDDVRSRVLFRTGSSVLDTSYAENAYALRSFVEGVNYLMKHPDYLVESIIVETGASPEGDPEQNERLAMDRARSVRAWLLSNLPLNASQVKAYSVGADWEGLWSEVWNSDSPWRDDVLEVISVTGVRTNAAAESQRWCLRRLKVIDGGKAWDWLMTDVFPDLRAGAGTLRCVTVRREANQKDTVVVIHEYEGPDAEWYLNQASRRAAGDAEASVKEYLRKKPRRHAGDSLWRDPVVALRMNMLAPLLNAGIEVPVGNRWSIAGDWYWPWLWRQWGNRMYTPQRFCFEGLGGYLEGRYWFGNNHLSYDACRRYRLRGHSLGVILSGGYYDYQYDWKGRQGEYGAAGIGYMYGLTLGRRGGIHLEFEVAVGYLYTQWRSYEVHEEGGPLVGDWDDGSWHGVVPLKAGVNLVVPIFSRENRK